MVNIKLKGLQFTRCRNWLIKAEACLEGDPVSAFIFAWISFNHYYSTFAMENKRRFDEWKEQQRGSSKEKMEILFLVNSQEFREFFDQHKTHRLQHVTSSIKLPVIDMLYRTRVPNRTERQCRLSDLANEDIFRVIYQIRNNLFHGSKDPTKDDRDCALCVAASEFMIPLVKSLLTVTSGEGPMVPKIISRV